jgi:hypothetical protein
LINALSVIVLGLAEELRRVWTDFCGSRRSLSMSLAFTIIVLELVWFFVVLPSVRPAGVMREDIESTLVFLGAAAGILGAAGLLADRRRRRNGIDCPVGESDAEDG